MRSDETVGQENVAQHSPEQAMCLVDILQSSKAPTHQRMHQSSYCHDANFHGTSRRTQLLVTMFIFVGFSVEEPESGDEGAYLTDHTVKVTNIKAHVLQVCPVRLCVPTYAPFYSCHFLRRHLRFHPLLPGVLIEVTAQHRMHSAHVIMMHYHRYCTSCNIDVKRGELLSKSNIGHG